MAELADALANLASKIRGSSPISTAKAPVAFAVGAFCVSSVAGAASFSRTSAYAQPPPNGAAQISAENFAVSNVNFLLLIRNLWYTAR